MAEIITKDGKDYLVSYIAKINNSTINAQGFFVEAQETLNKLVNAYNKKHKTNTTFLPKDTYGAPLQSLLNKYSGTYMSPSFMLGYQTNPALSLVSNFFVEQSNDATAIGTAFHKVMEDYYQLPAEQRTRGMLPSIEERVLRLPQNAGMNRETLDRYVAGYADIKDYLHPRSELDDTKLQCLTEHRGMSNDLYVKDLKWKVPCSVSFVADRIDFRNGEAIILDYKTGSPKDKAATFDGYLGSMILYKWAMEQEFNQHPELIKQYGLNTAEITKGYLICPGNSASKKYLELDFSLENQEKMKAKIELFYRNFMRDNRSHIYDYTGDGYFTSEDAKYFRATMMDNTIWDAKIRVEYCIGKHEDSYL